MEYKLLKKIISELEIISMDKTYKSDIKKNKIIDCIEIIKDIIYSINDVIIIYDATPKIIWINNSCLKVYGYTTEEILSNGYDFMFNRVHPDNICIIKKRNDLFINGTEYNETIRIKHKDGHYLWIKLSGKVFKTDLAGKPLLFLNVSSDITEIITAKDTINNLLIENEKSNMQTEDNKISLRELEILELIAEGIPGKQIGDRLNISFNTVRTHRNNIMRKLNINCTAGLVNYYREMVKKTEN